MQANTLEPPPPTFDEPDDDGADEPRCFDCGRYGVPRAELAWKGRPAHTPILERYPIERAHGPAVPRVHPRSAACAHRPGRLTTIREGRRPGHNHPGRLPLADCGAVGTGRTAAWPLAAVSQCGAGFALPTALPRPWQPCGVLCSSLLRSVKPTWRSR